MNKEGRIMNKVFVLSKIIKLEKHLEESEEKIKRIVTYQKSVRKKLKKLKRLYDRS